MSAVAWSDLRPSAAAPRQRHLSVVAAPVSEGVRLTRRGRLVRAFAVAVLVAVAAFAAWSATAQAADLGTEGRVVTVVQGDTLAEIAARELPEQPVDHAVMGLVRANDLSSDQVMAGQRLVIPGA